MINLLFRNVARFNAKFKIENYNCQDFVTMCGLLREKYQVHNQEIKSSGLIKLLDDAGRVIGVYTASEARKKSEAMGLDMILLSEKSSPIICKAVDFRVKTINNFFNEIVSKSQKQRKSFTTKLKQKQVQ